MESVEKLAQELGITAGEVNEMLTAEERAAMQEDAGDTPVESQLDGALGPDKAPATPVAPVVSKEDTERLQALGKETAHEIENARSASDNVAKRVLVKRAEEVAAKPEHAAIFLDGFASGLTEYGLSDGIVRTRKTEAKAVIDAYRKTVTDNLTDARKALIEFTGGYHDFILKAREIRGPLGHKSKAPGTHAPKSKLNESETQRAKDLIHTMSASQAMDAAVVVGNQLLKQQNGELSTIRLVANVYLQPLMLSKDAGIRKWATDAQERALQILDAADKANIVTAASDNTGHGVISVPQPEVQTQQIAA